MSASRTGAGVPLAAGVIVLALATAITHLTLGLQLLSFGGTGLGLIFVLNFAGYVTLTALLYLPVRALEPYRGAIRTAFIAYTALTIVLWIFFGTKDVVGYLNKLNEIALIALLVVESRLKRG